MALSPELGGVRDVTSTIISHEDLKNESAVYKLWVLYFQRISFQIVWRSQELSLCNVAALKSISVHRYSVVIFLHFLLLWDCRLFESRVALNPGLGRVRDVASAIISHEQTK